VSERSEEGGGVGRREREWPENRKERKGGGGGAAAAAGAGGGGEGKPGLGDLSELRERILELEEDNAHLGTHSQTSSI
jgi:hypothetical protein